MSSLRNVTRIYVKLNLIMSSTKNVHQNPSNDRTTVLNIQNKQEQVVVSNFFQALCLNSFHNLILLLTINICFLEIRLAK